MWKYQVLLEPMILHHYNLSPFSEKIRLMFGHCEMSWSSVISPAMPPRPIVDPLAGGYRRIPVAQLGADIFCDTRIITSEIADLSGRPEMAMENCSKEIQGFVNHVDSTVFTATVRLGKPLKSMVLLFTNFMPLQVYRFIKDREGIGKTSSMPRLSQSQALKVLQEFKVDLEYKLAKTPFIFGDTPTIADFSSYHLFWFAKNIISSKPLEGFPKAELWLNRMSEMGHGQGTKMSKAQVFEAAANNQPRAIPKKMQKGALIGSEVEIRPSDYAKNAVSGSLVGSSDLRWILARETDQFGTLHVHFPKSGFELKEV